MTVKNSHKLKNLNTQIKEIEKDIEQLQIQCANAKHLINDLKSEKELLQRQANKLTGGKVILTEHALLRYFERFLGYNLEDVRAKILTPDIERMIKFAPNGKIPYRGHHLVIRDKVIVTIE